MAASENFIHWVTKSAAGLRQPGLRGELAADLTAVRRAGIDVLVTLTSEALLEDALRKPDESKVQLAWTVAILSFAFAALAVALATLAYIR